MEQLVKLYKETHLAGRLPAYDGRKSLYTAGPLPFSSKEFKITLVDEEDGPGGARYFFLAVFSTHILIFFLCPYYRYYMFCSEHKFLIIL